MWWICSSGHCYQTVVANRCGLGNGCPKCKYKTEKLLLEFLITKYSDVVHQFKICGNSSFDFYIPSLRTIIELDGIQHFTQVSNWTGCEENLRRDVVKMKMAIETGYRVIRISQPDVYDSLFKGDGSWAKESLQTAIEDDSKNVHYLSKNDTLYNTHIESMASQTITVPTV